MLKSVQGTPREPTPGEQSVDLPEPITIEPEMPEGTPGPARTFDKDAKGKRAVYIRKADLAKYVHTAGCPACDAQRAGESTTGKLHTAQCRMRLEKAMDEDPAAAPRLEEARTRQTEWLSRELERADKKQKTDSCEVPMPAGSSDSHATDSPNEQAAAQHEGTQDAEMHSPGGSTKRAAEADADESGAVAHQECEGTRAAMQREPAHKCEADMSVDEHYQLERVVDETTSMRRDVDAVAQWCSEAPVDDDEEELDELLLQLRRQYLLNLAATSDDKPVCEETAVPYAYHDCGWGYVDDMSGKYLNNTLVENARSE